jgi:hypothetical protein
MLLANIPVIWKGVLIRKHSVQLALAVLVLEKLVPRCFACVIAHFLTLQTTFAHKAFIRALDASDGEEATMWNGVNEGFKDIVRECVDSGRQYRISFESIPFRDETTDDPAKTLVTQLLRACGVNAEWDELPTGRVLLPQVIKHLTDSKKESLVVINLDETNVLLANPKGVQYLKNMLLAVREVNRLQIGFVYIILSGTNVRKLHDAMQTASNTAPMEIPLPLLEVHHMQEVLLDLGNRGAGGGVAKSLGKELEFVLQVLGGVPRYVEMLAFLLGTENEKFSHARYCTKLNQDGNEGDARGLLERVKNLIFQAYGDVFVCMMNGLKLDAIMTLSLFAWPVSRTDQYGGNTIGELETCGVVFLQPHQHEGHYVIKMPLC